MRDLIALIAFQRRVDAVVMLFRRTVDLDQFHAYSLNVSTFPPSGYESNQQCCLIGSCVGREVWTVLKRSEQVGVRRRLGESLARLFKEHEVPSSADQTAIVFMTEIEPGTATGVEASGATCDEADHI